MKMTIEDLSLHARELYDIIKDAHRKAVLLRQAADNYDQHFAKLPFDYSTGCEAGLERAFDEIQQVYEQLEQVRFAVPTPVAPGVIATTAKENAELLAIHRSDYHDSDKLDNIIGNPVWTFADTKSLGGVYASLIKKKLIDCQGKGRNATVMLTEAARPILIALLAKDDEQPEQVVVDENNPMPPFDLTDVDGLTEN